MRSGYHYFLKDITEGMMQKNGWIYSYHQFYYFFSPILFFGAVAFDTLNHSVPLQFNLITAVILTITGSSLISSMRQLILRGKITFKYAIPVGVVGLILLLPLSFYALITKNKEHIWLTR